MRTEQPGGLAPTSAMVCTHCPYLAPAEHSMVVEPTNQDPQGFGSGRESNSFRKYRDKINSPDSLRQLL